jgi:cobalt-zinc-cadmium efflux system outer membrane protein
VCFEKDGPQVGNEPEHEVHPAFERWVYPSASTPDSKSGTLTLPESIQACVVNNLRIQAGGEKIHQARSDLWTASLIPNSELFADYQLIPLQSVSIHNQAGPPQADVLVTIPIDWLVYGKRLAAMEATRLGIDVASAAYADQIRAKVNETVLAFYDLLEAQHMFELAKEDVSDLQRIAEIVKKQVDAGSAGAVENDRISVAVLEAQREQRKREAVMRAARARLRPLIGRTETDDFEVRGNLHVVKAAPALKLDEALAERNRPDLLSSHLAVQQAQANMRRERKKALPTLSIMPGYSYQNQNYQNGFKDAHLATIGVISSLPVTDRNQGNISKAQSLLRESELTLQSNIADARSEVEQAVIEYRAALELVTTESPALIAASKHVRDRSEEAFKAGSKSLLALLEDQRAYREHYRTVVNSQANYWRALQRLHAAIGVRHVPEDGAKTLPPAK